MASESEKIWVCRDQSSDDEGIVVMSFWICFVKSAIACLARPISESAGTGAELKA